jgi:hypothetical protein
MRKVVQILDEAGQPAGGRVFEAPDAESLTRSMEDLPAGRWREVPSEADLVIPEPPAES